AAAHRSKRARCTRLGRPGGEGAEAVELVRLGEATGSVATVDASRAERCAAFAAEDSPLREILGPGGEIGIGGEKRNQRAVDAKSKRIPRARASARIAAVQRGWTKRLEIHELTKARAEGSCLRGGKAL